MTRFRFFCLLLVLGNCFQACCGEAILDRFRKEAPARWAEYRSLASRCDGIGRKTMRHRVDGATKETKGDAFFAIDGPCARISNTMDGVRVWEVVNSRYEFGVKPAKDGGWQLGYLDLRTPKARSEETPLKTPSGRVNVLGDPSVHGVALASACKGMLLWVTWLPEMVRSPDFRPIRATEEPGNKDLIRVEYAYEPADPLPNDYVRSGVVVLDTKRYWLIRNAEYKGVWAGGNETGCVRVTNEYDDSKMSFPVLKRQTEHVTATDGKRQSESDEVWVFEIKKPSPDGKQFTLSAFDLPEPAAPQDQAVPLKRTNRWVLPAVLGATILCLIVWRTRVVRRKHGETDSRQDV